MKLLLIITAIFEGVTGLVFLTIPRVIVPEFLGVALDTAAGMVAGRLAGAAILSLAVACWQARNGDRGGAATGLVAAMLFYNIVAALILVYAEVRLGLHGPMLWPAIVVHNVLAMWCAAVLWIAFRDTTKA
jgi:hypothetical protein